MAKSTSVSKKNRLLRLAKSNLHQISSKEQLSFTRWLNSQRSSKNSQQEDLPSSQLPTKMSQVSASKPQLLAIIDTCSICSFRSEFIDYVVDLKKLFPQGTSPVKIIISLVVLEELDKCNRSKKRQSNQETRVKSESDSSSKPESNRVVYSDPPRMFMRFIEEEMRLAEVLISDLDPFREYRKDKNPNFEIVNNDDRILDCCLRSINFVDSLPHHSDTRVILITEDNVFKSKATTFGIVSFRWKEFKLKYKNFGLQHYTSTPLTNIAGMSLPTLIPPLGPLLKAPSTMPTTDEKEEDQTAASITTTGPLLNLGMTIRRDPRGRFVTSNSSVEKFKKIMGFPEESNSSEGVMIVEEVIDLR